MSDRPGVGYVDLSPGQWDTIRKLVYAHAEHHRRVAVSIEQSQGSGMTARLTLHYEQAEFAHAAFQITTSGAYKTLEP